jgi:putative pyruvate formate lyase activating enzyme
MRIPSYRTRLTTQQIRERAGQLRELLAECTLCPRTCGAHRLEGKYGVCRSTDSIVISGVFPHFGEEAPLVGSCGSGTIFFTSCNLKCLFCQNYDISHLRSGHPVSIEGLADRMLWLQDLGCHNINLVTPTHVTPHIVVALAIAADRGLALPLVYNCGGYESVETLRLLDDIVDIYMPDIKYGDNEPARRYSGAKDYWDVVRRAVREMHRQVGNLQMDDQGVAYRGLLIRHLVLPGGTAGSPNVLDFIARDVSVESYVNIMDQYRPVYKARMHDRLNHRTTPKEYAEAISRARRLGLHRGFTFHHHD